MVTVSRYGLPFRRPPIESEGAFVIDTDLQAKKEIDNARNLDVHFVSSRLVLSDSVFAVFLLLKSFSECSDPKKRCSPLTRDLRNELLGY